MSVTLVRVAVAALLFVHGIARVGLGEVDDLGNFLQGRDIPAAGALAWVVTVLELAGPPVLAAGRYVIPVAAWFIAQLSAGIYLVHAREGWFVVGPGVNGVEYNVLLIVCLVAILLAERSSGKGWGSRTRK